MKVSDKKPHSVHLRLTDEQYEFLQSDADMLGVSITDYIRMTVNTTMYAAKKVAENIRISQGQLSMQLGDLANEDDKNNKQHLVQH